MDRSGRCNFSAYQHIAVLYKPSGITEILIPIVAGHLKKILYGNIFSFILEKNKRNSFGQALFDTAKFNFILQFILYL